MKPSFGLVLQSFCEIITPNPLKQGLKPGSQLAPALHFSIITPNPLKQGLKLKETLELWHLVVDYYPKSTKTRIETQKTNQKAS